MLCLEIMGRYKDWSIFFVCLCALCVKGSICLPTLKYDIQVGIAYSICIYPLLHQVQIVSPSAPKPQPFRPRRPPRASGKFCNTTGSVTFENDIHLASSFHRLEIFPKDDVVRCRCCSFLANLEAKQGLLKLQNIMDLVDWLEFPHPKTCPKHEIDGKSPENLSTWQPPPIFENCQKHSRAYSITKPSGHLIQTMRKEVSFQPLYRSWCLQHRVIDPKIKT